MALQKLVPTGGLAAQRSGIQSAAVADVVDGRIAHLESEIVQGTHDALAAPGRIFLEQFDHEFLQRRIDGWSTEGVGPGKGPLLGDQDTEPTEQGIWSDQSGQSPKAAPADELGFASQPDSLGVGEALEFATELFQENAILFLEVIDDSLLVSAHPAGDKHQEELELSRPRVENLSEVPSAQSSIWSRLNFLAVQGGAEMCFFGSAGQKWIETPWQMPLILLPSIIKLCLSNFGFVGRESRILRSRGQFVDSNGQCNYKTHFPR